MELDLTKPETTEKNLVQDVRLSPSNTAEKQAKVIFSGPSGSSAKVVDITDILSGLSSTQRNSFNAILKKIVAKAGNKNITDVAGDFYEEPAPVEEPEQ